MFRAVLSFILSVFSMASALLAEPRPSTPLEQPNVILITIDALRQGRMSLYGHNRETTPYLDKFSRDAIVFENTYATSAHTSPSIISLLTGQVPPVHAQTSSFSSYDPLIPTPMRELAARGYETFGHFNSGPTYENLGVAATLQRREIEDFLSSRARTRRPFFAWIHTNETHLPYLPSKQFAGEFTRHLTKKGQQDPLETPLMRAAGEFRMIFRAGRFTVPYAHAEGVPVTEGDQETLRALYDECVLSADAKVGLWLDQMKKMDYSIGQSSLLPPTTEMNYWSMVGWDTLRQVMTAS
jgi:membrane-anchored protein YejM (alkaline phosphatase superfamily)